MQDFTEAMRGCPRCVDDRLVTESANVVVLVAHPDDETLWAGGTLLMRRDWNIFIGTLCRAGDPDRAAKFSRVLGRLGSKGAMADLDDGSEQAPLLSEHINATLLSLVPRLPIDLVITHAPNGEYTRHLRHEEISRGVLELWSSGVIQSRELWLFAYDDEGGRRLPCAAGDADLVLDLPEEIWASKRNILTSLYGFAPESWEVRTTPRQEAYWRLVAPEEALGWLERGRLEK